tara:strand:- start:815 stop:1879 length:1065 start_codon:yes stop_codon:yes gene_type:complete
MSKKNDNIKSNFIFDESSITFFDILLFLAENIKFIVGFALIPTLISVLYLQVLAENEYVSSAKIISSTGNQPVSGAAGFAAELGIVFPNLNQNTQWVYKDIIKSRTILTKVLKKRFKTDKYGNEMPLIQLLTHKNNPVNLSIDTLEYYAFNKLNQMVEVDEDKKTGIKTIMVNAFEPKLARSINQSIISVLDDHQQTWNTDQIKKTKSFIEERIIDNKKELSFAEQNLKKFREQNRRIENSPNLLLEQERLEREVIVLTGVYTTLKQQLESTKIEEVKESNYVIVLDPPHLPIERVYPKKKKMVLMTFFAGLLAGFFISFFKTRISSNSTEENQKIEEIISLLKSYLPNLSLKK